jgi:hypothetical protein
MALAGPPSHGKAEMLVRATEEKIEQIRHIHHLPIQRPWKPETELLLWHGIVP